jgi:SAM-dependent methyltransferase
MTSEAYDAFAYAYDRALGERFFKAASLLLEATLDCYPTPKRTHLDVACGTGMTVRWFRDRGWKSTGIDASLPMLQIAGAGRQSAVSRFVAGDMRRLPFRRKFARITCLYDSLNHLLDPDDLQAAFHSIRGVMDDDSLFLFDVNHPEIYPEVWGLAEPYISKGRDYHLEIATTYRKREKIGRAAVTGWAKINGQRVAIREQHRQRAYSEREIRTMLAAAGLASVDVLDFDPYGEASDIEATTVKLFFIVKVL